MPEGSFKSLNTYGVKFGSSAGHVAPLPLPGAAGPGSHRPSLGSCKRRQPTRGRMAAVRGSPLVFSGAVSLLLCSSPGVAVFGLEAGERAQDAREGGRDAPPCQR